MKIVTIFFVGVILVNGMTGCMTVNVSTGSLDKTVSMTGNVNKKFTVVKHFRKESKSWFLLFNLITLSEPKIREIIESEIQTAQGDAVANLSVQGQTTLVDGGVPVIIGILGSMVTPNGALASNIVGARTYTIEGDVIKYIE